MAYTEARGKASIIYNTEFGTTKRVASHTDVVKTKRHKDEYYYTMHCEKAAYCDLLRVHERTRKAQKSFDSN